MTIHKGFLLLFFGVATLSGPGSPGFLPSPVGRPARDWKVENWMNSDPIQLADLRGKVILIRWWTGPGCPYCTVTAPALRQLHRDYATKGLQVLAFYHQKGRQPVVVEEVEAMARELGFTFPVAIDPEWRTLRDWWLDDYGSGWTSVTFLIDRRGIIRHVHPGGSLRLGSPDYLQIRLLIDSLLERD